MANPSTNSKHAIKFGTDGWRAIIGKEFNEDNLTLFNLGLAVYLLANYPAGTPLVIGYDAREHAPKFAEYSSELMNALGIPTLVQHGHCPTPVIAHAAKYAAAQWIASPSTRNDEQVIARSAATKQSPCDDKKTCGAMMFTASHNPPEYMGIKYIPEYAGPSNVTITNAILAEINKIAEQVEINGLAKLSKKELIKLIPKHNSPAQSQSISAFPAYKEDLKKLVSFDTIKQNNARKQLTVVYDSMYGAGRGFTDTLLRELGFNVIALHDKQDYSFGGSLPEPREDLLTELRDTVIQSGAAFGAANDGDADRFAMMSSDGGFFPANKALSIILKYLLDKGLRGTVVRTVVTTHLLDEIAAKYGCKSIETPVGFKWLCEVMRREPTLLAAEESGGMSILGHIPEKDGILATLMMAEVLAVTGKTLAELWQEVQELVGKNYYYNRLDLHMDGAVKDKFVATFADPNLTELAGYKVMRVDRTEGTKVYLDNGAWFLARPSGTEAMCRVYVEANDETVAAKISCELEEIVTKIAS